MMPLNVVVAAAVAVVLLSGLLASSFILSRPPALLRRTKTRNRRSSISNNIQQQQQQQCCRGMPSSSSPSAAASDDTEDVGSATPTLSSSVVTLERGMYQTRLGSIGYLKTTTAAASKDNGDPPPPILCFHSSPRSFDEFVEVMPRLATGTSQRRLVAAIDCPGYGISPNPTQPCTIDEIADAYMELVDHDQRLLLLRRRPFIMIGSLFGNYIAMSIASRYPDRVCGMICTNLYYNPRPATPLVNQRRRAAVQQETVEERGNEEENDKKMQSTSQPPSSPTTCWELEEDGSHLVALHNKRKSFLDSDLNARVVLSEYTHQLNQRQMRLSGAATMMGTNSIIRDYDTYDLPGAVSTLLSSSSSQPGNNLPFPILAIKGVACMDLFDRLGLEGNTRFDQTVQLFKKKDDNNDACGDGTSSSSMKQQHQPQQAVAPVLRVAQMTGPHSTVNLINQDPDQFAALCNTFIAEDV